MAKVTTTKALAARKSWQERAETWRDKINVAKLITRAQDFVFGVIAPSGWVVLPVEPTPKMLEASGMTLEAYNALVDSAPEAAPVVMSPAQVKSLQVLLDRVMPTLSASEITHKDERQTPDQLIQLMRERYGDEFADKLVKDYAPLEEETETRGNA